jgi:hypothetical protein
MIRAGVNESGLAETKLVILGNNQCDRLKQIKKIETVFLRVKDLVNRHSLYPAFLRVHLPVLLLWKCAGCLLESQLLHFLSTICFRRAGQYMIKSQPSSNQN